VRDAVHVVDLGGQQQLADVGEHRVGHEAVAVLVGLGVDAGGHAAGEEALGDGDELDHLLAQVGFPARIKAVGLAHQRARADQQVAKTGACADAGVAVVRGVAVGQVARMLPFAGVEHVVHGHEHALENAHAGALAVFAAEQGVAVLQRLAGAPGGAGDDGQARRIDRHGAADGEVGVFRPMLRQGMTSNSCM
jgi:hypothetical protein